MKKQKTFTEIFNQWCLYFSKMVPGQVIEIAEKAKSNPALFIEVCKEFMDQGNIDFTFSSDMRYFKRTDNF